MATEIGKKDAPSVKSQFKYRKLARHIEERIKNGEYALGARLPSERELGEAHDASRVIVRIALKHLEEKKLIYRVPGKGTYVGSAMDAGKPGRTPSGLLALTVLSEEDESMVSQRIISTVRDEAQAAGYHIVVSCPGTSFQSEAKLVDDLIRKNVDGLMITPVLESDTGNRELYTRLTKNSIPFVLIDRPVPDPRWSSIIIDSGPDILRAVRHFADLGHRRIAYIGPQDYLIPRERFRGYLAGLAQAGMEVDKTLFWLAPQRRLPVEKIGAAGARELLKRNVDFTALVCYSDIIALGAWRELRNQGWSPQPGRWISGFDNLFIPDEDLKGSLVTFRRPLEEMGRRAVHMLLNKISAPGQNGNETIRLSSEFILPDGEGEAL